MSGDRCGRWARALVMVALAWAVGGAAGGERPSFLLITSEDMSPDLGSYGDATAVTPRLDGLAAEGVRYTSAFANAPVCSPARTALFFSRYQQSLGASNHRSWAAVPEGIGGFAEALREAGYFCTNYKKLDINVQGARAIAGRGFDSGEGWWDRPREDQPFLSIINLEVSHQSRTSVWPRARYERELRPRLGADEVHDPAEVRVPPYYPDTPGVRSELARYADCVTLMDREAGAILDRLEADGLAEDTIVLYFADHGAGHAGHKRTALARGTRVPLIVRVPTRWAHLATAGAGETDDRVVSLVDIGPSLLFAAGVDAPSEMDGVAFFRGGQERELAFIARDRIDEDIDYSRMVTDGRFVYVRHYFPARPLWTRNGYAFPSAIYRAVEDVVNDDAASPIVRALVTEPRGVEMLFDLRHDADEVQNLAGNPAHAERVRSFHAALRRQQAAKGDLGLVPEGILDEVGGGRARAELARDPLILALDRVLDVADWVGRDGVTERQIAAAGDTHPAVRYWAVVGLDEARASGVAVDEVLVRTLGDASATVRASAAVACLRRGIAEAAARGVLLGVIGSDGYYDALHAAREGQVLGLVGDDYFAALRAAHRRWDRPELRFVFESVSRVRRGEERAIE